MLVQFACNTASHVLVFSPGGDEELFREVAARDSDDIAAILDRFGCRIVGPTLREGVYTFNSPATDQT